jgi:hypothetical protein
MYSVSRWEVWGLSDPTGYVKYVRGLVSVVIFEVLSSWEYTRISEFLQFLELLMESNSKNRISVPQSYCCEYLSVIKGWDPDKETSARGNMENSHGTEQAGTINVPTMEFVGCRKI